MVGDRLLLFGAYESYSDNLVLHAEYRLPQHLRLFVGGMSQLLPVRLVLAAL